MIFAKFLRTLFYRTPPGEGKFTRANINHFRKQRNNFDAQIWECSNGTKKLSANFKYPKNETHKCFPVNFAKYFRTAIL